MADGGRHPVVFEAAGRIQTLVLQMEIAGARSDVFTHRVSLLQDGLPLANGDNLVVGSKRQQLPKPPYAAEIERLMPVRPVAFEFLQRPRYGQAVPIVLHIQQAAAGRACCERFVDGKRLSAIQIEALLIRNGGLNCG